MADPTLALVTGRVWSPYSVDSTPAPLKHGRVVFTPLVLDESGHLVESDREEVGTTGGDGYLRKADNLGPGVYLWPGLWRISLPDGEVIDGADHAGVLLAAGESYDLHALRGYVSPPLTSVQVIQVPQNLAADVAQAIDLKDAAEAASLSAAESASTATLKADAAAQSALAADGSADAAALAQTHG